MLTNIIESKVKFENGKIVGEPLSGGQLYEMDNDQSVSMLMFGLQTSLFDYIEEDMPKFFKNHENNLNNCEYLLPEVLGDMLSKKLIKIKLIPTHAVWKGVTYREDLDDLKVYINGEIKNGVYPEKLYS